MVAQNILPVVKLWQGAIFGKDDVQACNYHYVFLLLYHYNLCITHKMAWAYKFQRLHCMQIA